MKRKLHTSLSAEPGNTPVSQTHHILLQSFLEEEYAAELAHLKQARLEPRPEAVASLLQQIAGRQQVAEQH